MSKTKEIAELLTSMDIRADSHTCDVCEKFKGGIWFNDDMDFICSDCIAEEQEN